ncbi:LysR family transcriptional regulator [Nocardiopsis aegyptia]|uniref:LysR family transcriptional regulator n=1 Tax=Nocardiopsis aegyptia TaxID=220378 RepID=UPI003672A995
MERRQLEYFLAVVDHQGITAAAAALRVSQPSLSQGIRQLERDLGTPLFDRIPRGVRLTSAGEAPLAPARQVVRDLATARSAVQDVRGLAGGRLELAMLPALTLQPFAPVLADFRTRFPRVRIAISQPEEAAAVGELVRTGRAELGFLDQFRDTAGELETEYLLDQELLAVLPPDSARTDEPIGIGELLGHGLIAGTKGTLARDLVERWADEHGREAEPAIEVGRRETGVHLVVAGAGVSIFPEPLARVAHALGAVVRPLRPRLPRRIALCHRGGPMSPAARAFADLARQACR